MPLLCRIGFHDFKPTWRQRIGYMGQDWEYLELRECQREGCQAWVSVCECEGHDGEPVDKESTWSSPADGRPLYSMHGGRSKR